MAGTDSIPIKLAWDGKNGFWTCPALSLPVKPQGLTVSGMHASPDEYVIDKKNQRVRWCRPEPPKDPNDAFLEVRVTPSLVDETLTCRTRAAEAAAKAKAELDEAARQTRRLKAFSISAPIITAIITSVVAPVVVNKCSSPTVATGTHNIPSTQPSATLATGTNDTASTQPSAFLHGERWGDLAGDAAHSSFVHAGSSRELEGTWLVQLFEVDDKGQKGRDAYVVAGAGATTKPYPPEYVNIKAHESVLSMSTKFSTGDAGNLWGEGRISPGDFVTVLTWTDPEQPEKDLVSVNLLRLTRATFSKPAHMEGYRLGVSRDGKALRRSWIEYDKLR